MSAKNYLYVKLHKNTRTLQSRAGILVILPPDRVTHTTKESYFYWLVFMNSQLYESLDCDQRGFLTVVPIEVFLRY
jgi:hypothetical protein